MKIIFGLGNPEIKYNKTRHNIGFSILDSFASQHHLTFSKGHGNYLAASFSFLNKKSMLIKPLTYMNLSGFSVLQCMKFYKVSVSEILVVVDDINIPLGTIRLRPKGSDGGQNGLKHIISQLGRNDFPRLRFGIGFNQQSTTVSKFVLSKFRKTEESLVSETIKTSCFAILDFINEGIQTTMNRYNK